MSMENTELPVGTYVRYEIKGALDSGRGSGTIIKTTTGLIDGSERMFYIVQSEQRSNVTPAVLPDEIVQVGR
jgi:hypothetical protein